MSYYTKYKFHFNIITIYKIKKTLTCVYMIRLQLLTPRDINLQNWKYTAYDINIISKDEKIQIRER